MRLAILHRIEKGEQNWRIMVRRIPRLMASRFLEISIDVDAQQWVEMHVRRTRSLYQGCETQVNCSKKELLSRLDLGTSRSWLETIPDCLGIAKSVLPHLD